MYLLRDTFSIKLDSRIWDCWNNQALTRHPAEGRRSGLVPCQSRLSSKPGGSGFQIPGGAVTTGRFNKGYHESYNTHIFQAQYVLLNEKKARATFLPNTNIRSSPHDRSSSIRTIETKTTEQCVRPLFSPAMKPLSV